MPMTMPSNGEHCAHGLLIMARNASAQTSRNSLRPPVCVAFGGVVALSGGGLAMRFPRRATPPTFFHNVALALRGAPARAGPSWRETSPVFNRTNRSAQRDVRFVR